MSDTSFDVGLTLFLHLFAFVCMREISNQIKKIKNNDCNINIASIKLTVKCSKKSRGEFDVIACKLISI